MKARIELYLRRLGAAGIAGIGVLLACAGFYFTSLAPLEAEAAAQRQALERLKTRTAHRPIPSSGRADDLRRFSSLFPPAAQLTDEVEPHALAQRSGLTSRKASTASSAAPPGCGPIASPCPRAATTASSATSSARC